MAKSIQAVVAPSIYNFFSTISISKAILCVLSLFIIVGMIDKVRGNRQGYGEEFDKGLMDMGPLALSIVGIVSMAPVLFTLFSTIVTPVMGFFGISPAMFPSLFLAMDTGGYALAYQMAQGDDVLAIGILAGLITLPAGCIVGGLVMNLAGLAMPVSKLLQNSIPLFLLAAITALGLRFCRDSVLKAFAGFGKGISFLVTVSPAIAISQYLTDIHLPLFSLMVEENKALGGIPLEVALMLVGQIAIVLAGAFPFMLFVSRKLEKPIRSIGRKMGIDETSTTALLTQLANGLPMFSMIEQMNTTGKAVNVAFAVGGAYVLGDALAFAGGVEPAMVLPVIAAKLTAGCLSVCLAKRLISVKFALKGTIVHTPTPKQFQVTEGYLVQKDGVVEGIYSKLPERLSRISVLDYSGRVIVPGMGDLHLHAPQYATRGMGMDLEPGGGWDTWFDDYCFPEEVRYSDLQYAKKAYNKFADDLLHTTTTRFAVYATVHRPATILLMDILAQKGFTAYVGKVNCDRNSPVGMLETTEESLAETELWLKETKDRYQNVKPILTPRYISTCTSALFDGLRALAKKYEVPIQSHYAEDLALYDRSVIASVTDNQITSSLAIRTLMVNYFGGFFDNSDFGWTAALTVYMVVALVCIFLFWRKTKGQERYRNSEKFEFRQIGQVFRQNKAIRYVMAMFALAVFATSADMLLFVIYLSTYHAFGDAVISNIMLVKGIAAIVATFGVDYLSKRYSKRTAWQITIGLSVLSFFFLIGFLAEPGSIGFIYAQVVLTSLGTSAVYQIPWSMIPDTVEINELQTGQRVDGMLYGATAFVQKASGAVAIALVGFLLTSIGFDDAGFAMNGNASSVKWLYSLTSVLPLAISIIVAVKYPLSKSRHQDLLKAIEDQKNGIAYNAADFKDLM